MFLCVDGNSFIVNLVKVKELKSDLY